MSVMTQAPPAVHRHLKVWGGGPARDFEPCEDPGCSVTHYGIATSCGRLACPSCGCGGTNLSTIQFLNVVRIGTRVDCSCGHSWVYRGAGGSL